MCESRRVEPEAAIAAYEDTIRGAPNCIEAYYGLGLCRQRIGDFPRARAVTPRNVAFCDQASSSSP